MITCHNSLEALAEKGNSPLLVALQFMLHNVTQQNSILTNDKQLTGNSFAYSVFHYKATVFDNIKNF